VKYRIAGTGEVVYIGSERLILREISALTHFLATLFYSEFRLAEFRQWPLTQKSYFLSVQLTVLDLSVCLRQEFHHIAMIHALDPALSLVKKNSNNIKESR